jgi:hypothetical protein
MSANDINTKMGLKKDAFNIGTNSTTFEANLKDLLKRDKRTGRYNCINSDAKKLKKEDSKFPKMEIFDNKETEKAV